MAGEMATVPTDPARALVRKYVDALPGANKSAKVAVASEAFGVSLTTVWFWLSGERRPASRRLVRMAEELGDAGLALKAISAASS